jgi:hypothetical protein
MPRYPLCSDVIWPALAQDILGNVTKGLNFTHMYKDAAYNQYNSATRMDNNYFGTIKQVPHKI